MKRDRRDRNYEAYVRLDKRGLEDQYVVVVGGKIIGKGKKLDEYLHLAWKRFPQEIPFVAKVRNPKRLYAFAVCET